MEKSIYNRDRAFFKMAAIWRGASTPDEAAKWWEAFYEVILRELYANDECRLPFMGRFSVDPSQEFTYTTTDDKGRTYTYTVPARIRPKFTSCDDFVDDVNMKGVTKSYRARLRNGKLNERDYKRQMRAQSLDANSVKETYRQDNLADAKKEFRKMIQAKLEHRSEK